jgi:hypothetical protein
MRRIASTTLAVLLAAFAALHAYWALGGTWGLATALGPNTPRPSSIVIWAMAGVLVAFAACARMQGTRETAGRVSPVPVRFVLGLLLVGATLVGMANLVAGTTPAERFAIAPFALLIALLVGMSLWGPRTARHA